MRTKVAAPIGWLLGALVLVGALVLFLESVSRHATEAGVPEELSTVERGNPESLASSVDLRGEAANLVNVSESLSSRAPTSANSPAHVVAKPGEALVRGTLRLPDGSPARNASVALFARHGSEATGPPLAEGTCDARGAFALAIARTGGALLLASRPDCEAAARELDLCVDQELTLEPTDLAAGLSISGRVSAAGAPMPRCEVVAILDRAGERLKGTLFVRLDGRWLPRYRTAETDSEGRYEIGGLARELYQVRVSTIRGMQSVLGLVESAPPRDTRAPAQEIDFSCSVSTLRFRFVGANGPLSGVPAELGASKWTKSSTSDANGEVLFRVVPGLACTLTAGEPPAYRQIRKPFLAPPAGEERTEVVPFSTWREPPKIRFEIVSSTGERVSSARFFFTSSSSHDAETPAFYRDENVPKLPKSDRDGGQRSLNKAVMLDGKRPASFEFTDVAPGSYRVLVKSGGTIAAVPGEDGLHSVRQYCDEEIVLVVPATGLIERRVDVKPRGSLSITARDADGKLVPARCALSQLTGARQEFALLARGDAAWRSVEVLDPDLPTRLFPDTCGGSFDLELSSPGYRTKRFPVEITEATATPIDVVLERE